MDMSDTIVPKSDQLNAEDLLAGPRTVTITAVRRGSTEQPVCVDLEGLPGRPYKPGKSMRRVMVAAWGVDSAAYVGQSMTLYRDGSVRFGGMDVGGIRISHMTGLDEPLRIPLTVTKGKREPFTVHPLAVAALAQQQAPTALDQLSSALRFAGWDKVRVEQEVGHELAAFGDLTEAEAQACLGAIRAEHDGEQDPSDEGQDRATSQVSPGEQDPQVEDLPADAEDQS